MEEFYNKNQLVTTQAIVLLNSSRVVLKEELSLC